MKNTFLMIIVLVYTNSIIAQDIIPISETKKNEILDFDYTSYVGNAKTINQLFNDLPILNNPTFSELSFHDPEMGVLCGLAIFLDHPNGEDSFYLEIYISEFVYITRPWQIEDIKQEKIAGITIFDSSQYSSIVKSVR